MRTGWAPNVPPNNTVCDVVLLLLRDGWLASVGGSFVVGASVIIFAPCIIKPSKFESLEYAPFAWVGFLPSTPSTATIVLAATSPTANSGNFLLGELENTTHQPAHRGPHHRVRRYSHPNHSRKQPSDKHTDHGTLVHRWRGAYRDRVSPVL